MARKVTCVLFKCAFFLKSYQTYAIQIRGWNCEQSQATATEHQTWYRACLGAGPSGRVPFQLKVGNLEQWRKTKASNISILYTPRADDASPQKFTPSLEAKTTYLLSPQHSGKMSNKITYVLVTQPQCCGNQKQISLLTTHLLPITMNDSVSGENKTCDKSGHPISLPDIWVHEHAYMTQTAHTPHIHTHTETHMHMPQGRQGEDKPVCLFGVGKGH